MRPPNVRGVRQVGYFTVWIFLVATLCSVYVVPNSLQGPFTTKWLALPHCIWVALISNPIMETSVLTWHTSWNLTWEPGSWGAQILGGRLLWQLNYIQRHLIFAPCHCSGTWKFEVAPTFLEEILHSCLIGPQQVKIFHTFDGTRRFIAMFTRVHHLFVSLARSIMSIPLILVSVRCHLYELSTLTSLHL
jgi:hypothetical protein